MGIYIYIYIYINDSKPQPDFRLLNISHLCMGLNYMKISAEILISL